MAIIIKGRYSEDNITTQERDFTIDEINELIKDDHRGMITMMGSYEIEGISYHASGVSLGDDTFVQEKDGKLVIPTYFQKRYLANYNSGDQSETVKVDIIIDPSETEMQVLMVKQGS